MKLEVGKKYVTRNGDVDKIVRDNGGDGNIRFVGLSGETYTEKGRTYNHGENPRDLISEYHSAEPEQTSSPTYNAAYLAAMVMGADHGRATDIAERLEDLV